MCCQETRTLNLPPEVIEALARYRRLLDERGWDWGDEQLPDFFRWARFSMLGPLFEAVADTGDWAKAIRSVVGEDVPPGVVVVRVDEGSSLRAYGGPARPALAGRTVPIDVVVDSASRADLRLTVAGRDLDVAPRGAAIETIDLDGTDSGFTVGFGDETLRVEGAIHPSAEAELRLSSPRCSRWSVTDSGGGAWFPEGALAKWTSTTGRSSTATTSPSRCRPSRSTWSAPEAWSSGGRSSTCSPPRARRASSSAIRHGCSTRPPRAGTAATCTST